MVRALTITGIFIFLFVSVGLFLAYQATQTVPEFYQLALAEDPEVQQQKSTELFNQTTRLAGISKRPGRWDAIFTEDQLNGFLAIDLEKQFTDILPAEIKNPRVMIKENELILACQYTTDSFDTVLTLSVDVYISKPNELAFRIRRAKAGSLPLPLTEVIENIKECAEYLEIPIQERSVDGDPVLLLTISAIYDEKREQHILLETVQLKPSEVHLIGRTINPVEHAKTALRNKFISLQTALYNKSH